MQYDVNNILKPTPSALTDPALEVGKTALNMVQKGILDAKIKIVDREEILEENLKRTFTTFHIQQTEILLTKMREDNKYEDI